MENEEQNKSEKFPCLNLCLDLVTTDDGWSWVGITKTSEKVISFWRYAEKKLRKNCSFQNWGILIL